MDRNEETGTFTPGRRQFLGVAGAATLAVGATQFFAGGGRIPGDRAVFPRLRDHDVPVAKDAAGSAMVSTSGYLITNLAANKLPLPAKAGWAWWYQYYFSTECGELGLTQYRHDIGELIWRFNSPTWSFSDTTYEQTAAAFDNPDYVAIVIGNYHWRLGLAPTEHRYAGIEKRLQQAPVISAPTITIDGADDPFTPAGDGAAYRAKFSGRYQHQTLPVGHNVPQEAPRAFADAVVRVDSFTRH
jgi:pimeloyl-ACP methyl ester carboxylesterase